MTATSCPRKSPAWWLRWWLTVCLLALSSVSWAANAWVPTSPLSSTPPGVNVLLGRTSSDPVFAGTSYGVYKSINDGDSWEPITSYSLDSIGFVYSLALAWTDFGTRWTLHAGTQNGVYRFIQNGDSWEPISNDQFLLRDVRSMAVAGGTLYAGTYGYGIFKSTDQGESWKSVNTGLGDLNVRTLAVHRENMPPNQVTLYAGTHRGGVFKSTNGGESWEPAYYGLGNSNVLSLAVHPDGQTLYAGTEGGGVFKSTNGGESWGPANTGLGNMYVQSLALHPDGQTLYAGTGAGGGQVFKSTNGGISWANASSGLDGAGVTSLALRLGGTTLFAGTSDGKVFKSTNGALTSENRLLDLTLSTSAGRVALFPAFNSSTEVYYATLQGQSVQINPTVWSGDASVSINVNGAPAGSGDAPVVLNPGNSTVNIVVTPGDGSTQRTYTINIGREVVAPSAATNVQAVLGALGSGQATVSWTPSTSSGTSPLTRYTVTGSPSGACTAGPDKHSCVVSGLNFGTPYSFTVTAVNVQNVGTTSAASNSVTPQGVQTISFPPQGDQSYSLGGTFTINPPALATSGLQVSYSSLSPGVCTVSGTTVAIQSAGICILAADQAGDTTWGAAAQVTSSLTVNPVAPAPPTDVQATPSGSGQITVTWVPPTDTGGEITGYLVSAQPGGQTCTPTPATATSCTFTDLTDGQTHTFTAETLNGAGSSEPSAPSNPATSLADLLQFSGTVEAGELNVTATGGGEMCRFEYIQTVPASSASVPPPAHLQFPYELLDFVLAGCDQTDVTVTINYPSALSSGATYWKFDGTEWAPYEHAVVEAGEQVATITLRDGGEGDADGEVNGRIVDHGQVAFGMQTISFPPQGNQSYSAGGTFVVNPLAQATSGLEVSYSSLSPGVCAVSGTTVTILSAGTCTLAADQAGDTQWAAAPQVTSSLTVNPVVPAPPADVHATPSGPGQVTVTWAPPTDTGGEIAGYLVIAQPGGQTCTPTPATATSCTFTDLTAGQTHTFTVETVNGAGSSSDSGTPPEPSNPATSLADPREFTGAVPGGLLNVTATGGGETCGFEHIQIAPPGSVSVPPPAHLQFPYELLDFVLAGCDQTEVTVSITYPSALPSGVTYWKFEGIEWAPYEHADVQAGTQQATITLRDGGEGDDDGESNGRIVDPGQVAFDTQQPLQTDPDLVPVPTLSSWALGLLGISLGLLAWRRRGM